MSKVNDTQIAVARVYSQALLDLAVAQGRAEEVKDELRWLSAHVAENEEFANFVSSPRIDAADRAASLEKIFRGKLSDLLVDGLQVIHRKGRLGLLPAIAEGYRQLLRDQAGRIDVHVRTAVPIDDPLRDRIRATIAEYSGKKPDLHEEIDESLIGGIVMHVEDRKVDASVSNEIRKLRQLLDARSKREIQRSRRVLEQ
ncbi:MAG: ATP synthase F1 subunit delta [Acidobacteriota bacterium]